jgi:hypothetical protein
MLVEGRVSISKHHLWIIVEQILSVVTSVDGYSDLLGSSLIRSIARSLRRTSASGPGWRGAVDGGLARVTSDRTVVRGWHIIPMVA